MQRNKVPIVVLGVSRNAPTPHIAGKFGTLFNCNPLTDAQARINSKVNYRTLIS